MKKNNYFHYICILIILIFLFFSFYFFDLNLIRLKESFIDLFNSIKYYAADLFKINLNYKITITDYSQVKYDVYSNLPDSWADFKLLFDLYIFKLFNINNFKFYNINIIKKFTFILKFLIIFIPIFFLFIIVMRFRKNNGNNDYNKISVFLKLYKLIEKKVIFPICNWIKLFISFINENTVYKQIWLLIWLYNFNFIVIIIEFVAYYIYFITSFDFISIYIQFVKFVYDLLPMFNFVPLFCWFLIIILLWNFIRRQIGFKILEILILRDYGFLNERELVSMPVGPMGSNKTSLITDFALSQEIIFRNKAFELLFECDLEFPNFPWINLELDLQRAIVNKEIFNLASCDEYINNKKSLYLKTKNKDDLYGYDFKYYSYYFDNNLTNKDIWDTIKDYSKLYFIYIVESSLIISNYSIRSNQFIVSNGNFPMWISEILKENPKYINSFSKFSHILDFDSLRLGKIILEHNKYSNFLEFGIINISEVGKERKNTVELQGIKKKDDSTNQKNDGFNLSLKMARHRATVRHFCFIRFFMDENRADSLGADARELTELIYIDNSSELKIACPFGDVQVFLLDNIINKIKSKYYSFRFIRGDMTLIIHGLHVFMSYLYKIKLKLINQFGYYKVNIKLEKGIRDGKLKKRTYYLIRKKIYSDRYSTDAFSSFFKKKALKSSVGLDDIPTYKNVLADNNELNLQHSYFINDLNYLFVDNELKESVVEKNNDNNNDLI